MSDGLAPTMLPDAAAIWRSALEGLSPSAPPCRYMAPAKWLKVRESALAFCDQYGAEAHRLGWKAPELFAVHPRHGTARLDACGVLMIGGEPVQGIAAERVIFERTSGYRNTPGQVWGVPVWEFARSSVGQ